MHFSEVPHMNYVCENLNLPQTKELKGALLDDDYDDDDDDLAFIQCAFFVDKSNALHTTLNQTACECK